MSDERDPVGPAEFVFRRVPSNYFDPSQPIGISPLAFRPNKNDMTGLSVLRELFSTAQDALATLAHEKRHAYCVARLAVSDLTRLGLTVVPEPDSAGPPGHAIIPELSWPAYHANKDALKDVQVELAMLASQSIVLPPTAP